MACARGVCTADKVFIFINVAFATRFGHILNEYLSMTVVFPSVAMTTATGLKLKTLILCSMFRILSVQYSVSAPMYSGALLATAARLMWDPSTYTWFRYLCEAQYRVSAGYLLAAGLWLAALVYLAASAAQRAAATCLHVYSVGVVCLAVSEVAYGAWMASSMVVWWRSDPQAELVRHGMDLLHDIKPMLLAVERYRHVARPLYDMIEEVERKAPNNAYVIFVFGVVGMMLQIAAFVMSRRLARRASAEGEGAERAAGRSLELEECAYACEKTPDDDGEATRDPPPGWRNAANLRMYTILDKIF